MVLLPYHDQESTVSLIYQRAPITVLTILHVFYPSMGATDGSMFRAGPRFVVASSGAKYLSCIYILYVYMYI